MYSSQLQSVPEEASPQVLDSKFNDTGMKSNEFYS